MALFFFTKAWPVRLHDPVVKYQIFGAGATRRLAAIVTRSARELAFIFRITLPRCAFTVISLMPRLGTDLLIHQAADNQRHDLPLAPTE
jgi:hypothetical protein